MYEIWSLGNKPFETFSGSEVISLNSYKCRTFATMQLMFAHYIASYILFCCNKAIAIYVYGNHAIAT